MNECINPALIEGGDLIAYVDGEAEPALRAHIDSCPACLQRANELGQVTQGVLGMMYRASCPEPEQLGLHHLKLLSASEELVMAAHLRQCAHCAEDLSLLVVEEEPDRLITTVWDLFGQVGQVIEGVFMPAPRRRGATRRKRDGKQEVQNYVADEVHVMLDFQPVRRGRKEGMLVGTILSAIPETGGQAWLFEEGEVPISTEIDRLGTFIFERMKPGNYDLALEVEQKAILLREVQVGG